MTTISEVMTKGVQVIPPDASLQRAAQLMDELNVGALPVCDGKSLVGMITDRDITVRATAAGLEPATHSVKEVMTETTRWCTEDQTTDEVMKQMGDVQIRRLPVLNDRHEVVGIVSLGDLALRQSGHTDELLRDVSWPSEPERPDANAAAHFTG
ncbi:CBS domain-containing protein [Piscinibacter terrae]|uniref:CBS domain-containing protein n=1 Tax=Piscinibacter terrae TaxID=2496871 RepID=A0A3N7HQ14_9BURK|nr:CBS domain-containing protein [Albitalea terrae]RQP22851.1 CBS domain-containing protein [Albitalea terrae]